MLGRFYMIGNRADSKKNVIITTIIIVVFVTIAAGLFLFFTLYDWSGSNHWEQSLSASNVTQTTSSQLGMTSREPIAFRQLDDPLLVLVNSEHKMPTGADSRVIERFGIILDERAMEAYEQMYAAAIKDNISLWVSSSYRDATLQGQLYQKEIDDNLKKGMIENEAVEAANKAVQKAGYSEHNTGLAFDFNGATDDFQYTKAYAWLMQNAVDYGFILRYPQNKEDITGIMYEPWHFRYVGTEHAKKMNSLDMCLEEYVEYVRAQQAQ